MTNCEFLVVSIPDGDSFLREENGHIADPGVPEFQSPMGIVSSAKARADTG